MTRYERVDKILAKADPASLRECPTKGARACRGCFGSIGITKSDYEKWKQRNKKV